MIGFLQTHVTFANEVIAFEFNRGTRELYPSYFQEIGAVDYVEDLLPVLFEEHNRQSLGSTPTNDIKDMGDGKRSQTRRWLIHQEQFGVGHQRSADSAHLLFAAG